MVNAIGSYNVQFSWEALFEAQKWTPGFNALTQKYGAGIICENENGAIVSFFPDQQESYLSALKDYFSASDLSWQVYPHGDPDGIYDILIHEMDGETLAACNNLEKYGSKYDCYVEDYCGANAPTDSLHPDGDTGSSSSPSSSSMAPTSAAPSSESNSSSTASPHSDSDSNSDSNSGSNSGSNSNSASNSDSNPGSKPSSTASPDSSSGSTSGSNGQWSGYSVNGTTNAVPSTTVTKKDLSTTLVTVTSCSDHVCSEVVQTTGVTTVTDEHTTYTTYCPLTTSEESPAGSITNTLAPSTVSDDSSATGSSATGSFSSSSSDSISGASSTAQVVPESANLAWKREYSYGSFIAGAVMLLL